MVNVVAFLTERIEEDERAAWALIDKEVEYLRSDGIPEATRDDLLGMVESDAWRRPLAECAAKRAIVEASREDHEHGIASGGDTIETATVVLLSLATVYAEHPNYRDEWRI